MFKRTYIPYIVLGLILVIGGYLRLYRIDDYMAFLGDEGRDALVVKRMIVDREFTLLGPITSVGLMHLGPMYYYFMAPFLALTRLDPVGPAIMVALFSLATIVLIWKLGQEFFDTKVATIASVLYALSPLVIAHSHSSWNPNILPFWALLIIYSLMQVVVKSNHNWIVITGAAIGVALQLHYIALVFILITFGVLVLMRPKLQIGHLAGLVLGSILTYSPFIIFEFRHHFINTLTVWQFVTRGGDAKSFGVMTFIDKFWDLSVRLFWRLVVIENAELSIIVMLAVLGMSVYLIMKLSHQEIKQKALKILLIWFALGIGLLSLYTGNIYDYYLMFTFPLPFLLIGITFSHHLRYKVGKLLVIVVVALVCNYYLINTPIAKEPNRLKFQTQQIAQFILDKSANKPFNFGLIAIGNSDHAYRYFLEIGGNPPVVIENPETDIGSKSVTDQLFVVCEEKICQPLGHPLWEIAGFGRAEITDEWQVGLFKVFRLTHYLGN